MIDRLDWFDWLIGWLTALVGWFNWLRDRVVDGLAGWFADWLIIWLAGLLICWPFDWLIGESIDWLVDWFLVWDSLARWLQVDQAVDLIMNNERRTMSDVWANGDSSPRARCGRVFFFFFHVFLFVFLSPVNPSPRSRSIYSGGECAPALAENR